MKTQKRNGKKSVSGKKYRDVLIEIAKEASAKAQRTSLALGLPINMIIDDVLIEKQPDGTITKIKEIEKVKSDRDGLEKGTVLCIKRKG